MAEQTEGSGPSELELLKDRARLLGVEFSNNIGLATLRERVNAKINEVNGESDQTDQPTEGDQQGNFDDDIEEEETETEQAPPALIQTPAEALAPVAPPVAPIPPVTPTTATVNGFDAAAQVAKAKIAAPATAPVEGANQIKQIAPVADASVDPTSKAKVGSPLAPRVGRTPTLRQHLYNEQMKLVRLRIQNLDPKKADLNGEIITVANKHLGNIKIFVPYGEVTDDGWHVPFIIYKELARRRFLSIRTIKDPRTKQPVVKKGWAKEFALDILPPLTEGEIKSLAVAQAAAGSIDSGNNDLL